jgi:hypothetical protein
MLYTALYMPYHYLRDGLMTIMSATHDDLRTSEPDSLVPIFSGAAYQGLGDI